MAPREQLTADTAADTVERMRALHSRLPAKDGVAVFHRIYLTVTEELAQRTGADGSPERRGTTVLDALLAQRYLTAVSAGDLGLRPPACWQPLLQYRHHPGVRPAQFALAGINAHVGHDLALAVVDACRLLECEPEELEKDVDRVDETLTLLEERLRDDLTPGPDLLELADPLTHLMGAWNLDRARDGAWSAARLLWRIRELPALAEEFAERLDTGAGLVGRCLLTPWP
ncbi:DUF5995 family protein [Streptomyces katsurahamanus]|uniref:Uncharacterized protein n=1 Tax=Streptomyces katsurahamanus TaxID=2577098 RepID=A0ABW9NUK8_9ACTN|nr:DUF5995 family protein [Streptomyces katsurahamanus]MQS36983.1 hypothetical protein [Streptomyces katsurahamanus]